VVFGVCCYVTGIVRGVCVIGNVLELEQRGFEGSDDDDDDENNNNNNNN
jgi:hypothetical protein